MKSSYRGLTTIAVPPPRSLTMLVNVQSEAQTAVPNAESNRFTPSTLRVDPETDAPQAARSAAGTQAVPPQQTSATFYREAPAAFDNRTNGFDPQGPAFDDIDEDTVVPLRSFNDNRFIFEEVETVADGLGPTFNAQACRECHQNIVTGGASQIAEHRTGRLELLQFVESVGGSLIQSRSTHPDIFENVPFEDSVSTFRISTNLLGTGFIEAIANDTLLAIRNAQPASIRGTGAGSGGARGEQRSAYRQIRTQESARQPGIVCGGRLSERDGHHHAGSSGGKHLAGQADRISVALRSGCGSRR